MSGHKHHIVPRHAGGDNAPENLTPPISIRLHAAFHWDRWKHVGAIQDKIAAFMLLGRITSEEARIAAARIGAAKRRGIKLTEEWVKNVSKALTGRKRKPFSLEHRANLRRTQLGRVRSPQAVAKTRAGLTGKPWSAKRRAATPLSTKKPRSNQHASIGKPWSEKRRAAQTLEVSEKMRKSQQRVRAEKGRTCLTDAQVSPSERLQRQLARSEKKLAKLLAQIDRSDKA